MAQGNRRGFWTGVCLFRSLAGLRRRFMIQHANMLNLSNFKAFLRRKMHIKRNYSFCQPKSLQKFMVNEEKKIFFS